MTQNTSEYPARNFEANRRVSFLPLGNSWSWVSFQFSLNSLKRISWKVYTTSTDLKRMSEAPRNWSGINIWQLLVSCCHYSVSKHRNQSQFLNERDTRILGLHTRCGWPACDLAFLGRSRPKGHLCYRPEFHSDTSAGNLSTKCDLQQKNPAACWTEFCNFPKWFALGEKTTSCKWPFSISGKEKVQWATLTLISENCSFSTLANRYFFIVPPLFVLQFKSIAILLQKNIFFFSLVKYPEFHFTQWRRRERHLLRQGANIFSFCLQSCPQG